MNELSENLTRDLHSDDVVLTALRHKKTGLFDVEMKWVEEEIFFTFTFFYFSLIWVVQIWDSRVRRGQVRQSYWIIIQHKVGGDILFENTVLR
jgi:hypothetical protein